MPPVKNPADIQLFDLQADPSETTNLQADHPETVIAMKKLLAEHISNGRSTAGEIQKNDPSKKEWKQIDWIKE